MINRKRKKLNNSMRHCRSIAKSSGATQKKYKTKTIPINLKAFFAGLK